MRVTVHVESDEATVLAIGLALALVFSFTLIPALAAVLFSAKESEKVPWIMQKLEELYDGTLRTALKHHTPVLIVSLVLLVIGGFLFSRLGAEFLPRLDEGSLVLQLTRDPSMSLDASVEQQKTTEAALLKFGAIEKTFSRIGTPEIATDPMGPNEVDNFVLLKDSSQWIHDGQKFSSKEKLIEAILKHLEKGSPNQEISATQPIQMRFNDMLEGTKSDLTVKVYGDDLKTLQADTKKIAEVIRTVPGSGDVQTEIKGSVPLLTIKPRLEALGRYSLSAAPVLDAIQIGMAGETVGNYYDKQIPVPLTIRLKESLRDSPETLADLQIGVDSNLTLPLKEVAEFQKGEIVSPILREFSKRRSAVLINPRGRDLQSFVDEAQGKINQAIQLAPGNRVEWFGTFKNLEDTRSLVTFNRLGYTIMKGLDVFFQNEILHADLSADSSNTDRNGLGLQFYPLPHFEFSGIWTKQKSTAPGSLGEDYAWLLMHYYF
ncbi:MAG: efflux RND transporter permease subunit [Bdellovibrionaceae bacterium]|nr:efflux RND transporter permease subunit [Pseudobdellovibrionaceae bacterium]